MLRNPVAAAERERRAKRGRRRGNGWQPEQRWGCRVPRIGNRAARLPRMQALPNVAVQLQARAWRREAPKAKRVPVRCNRWLCGRLRSLGAVGRVKCKR